MSFTKDQIIEAIAAMSIMDVAELVTAMEKKFGISATTVSSTTITENNINNNENIEEQTEFDVILQSVGPNKIAVIKVVRNIIGLGLKEAKDLVESAPVTLKENMNKDNAESLKKSLEETGAKIEIR